MLTINRFFIAIIQLVLLIDSTKESYVKQAMMTAKTFGSTMKSSMTMIHRNKNTIKNIAYGAQKKYLQTKHSFASKSVKYLGVEAIKKFKYTAPQAARGGKQLFSLEGRNNIQMRSASMINGKELSSLINMVSKRKFMLPFLAGGGLTRLTEFSLAGSNDESVNTDGYSAMDPPEYADEDAWGAAGKIIDKYKEAAVDYDKKDQLKLADGSVYDGDITEDGKMTGAGRLTYPDGVKVFEGNWVDGIMEGKGKLFDYETGELYEGLFKNNVPHGRGKKTYDDGSELNGNFDMGKDTGHGLQWTKKQELFIGNFFDGKMQGHGYYFSRDNILSYIGYFKDSVIHGKGTMCNNEIEDKYEGEYVEGKKHGYGEYFWKNGDYWKGNWENDLYSGEGEKYVLKTFTTTKGIWKEGVMVEEQ